MIHLMRVIDRHAAEAGYQPKQAKPLRWCHVELIALHTAKLLAQPGLPTQAIRRALTDLAMIAVSHDAALRSSELLALRWGDISRSEGSKTGRVLIRRSKTDQSGQGAVCTISAFALQAIERIHPPDAEPHHRIFPISASTFRRRLKAVVQQAGIDPDGISGHSPRIGMAQDLAAADTDMAAIMIAGRWKQPATAARYIRNLAADHSPVAQYLRTQDRMSDKPNILRLLPEKLLRLHSLTARQRPTSKRTFIQDQPAVIYSIRSLVKELAAQLATFSPEMGAREGQGRSKSTG
ncbi:MAG: tyrosine-type recombinase/integrase [bacterium]|nr:tyrosine-type recombinase/integrase [bacterium]